jgi:hypothetical protein
VLFWQFLNSRANHVFKDCDVSLPTYKQETSLQTHKQETRATFNYQRQPAAQVTSDTSGSRDDGARDAACTSAAGGAGGGQGALAGGTDWR